MTESVKLMLSARRERRRLLALGYHPHETNPEITRGHRRDEIIIDAIISADGKYIYTKIGKPGETAAVSEAQRDQAGSRRQRDQSKGHAGTGRDVDHANRERITTNIAKEDECPEPASRPKADCDV